MRKLRCSSLPGLSPSASGYQFNLFEDDLRLEIPGDHRGPDLIVPDDPAQEAWLRSWRGGLRETWYCQWHFTERAALDRFLTELGLPLHEPPAATPPPPAAAPPPPAVTPPPPATAPPAPTTPAWTITESWQHIEAWLAAHWPELLTQLAPGASPGAIAALEAALGRTLPDDVRDSLARHDGQPEGFGSGTVPGLIGNWELLGTRAILAQWSTWKALADKGSFTKHKAAPDAHIAPVWWHDGWIPLTYDGTGAHHCLDLAPTPAGRPGQLFILRPREAQRRVRYPSYRAWLAEIAHGLDTGLLVTCGAAEQREFYDTGFLR